MIQIGSFQVQSHCLLSVEQNKNAATGEKFHLKTQAGEYLIGILICQKYTEDRQMCFGK